MARLTFVFAALVLALAACGDSDVSGRAQIESEVSSAMEELPYSFSFRNGYSSEDYVVFRVDASASVNIAYGGKSRGGKCPRPPRLPARHRGGAKPFPAAGPERLICFEDDSWRPGSSEAATITRSRTAFIVAEALCREVYPGFDGFACFD